MTSLTQVFRVFLRIGCLSFGGPAAQIALMQAECVDRHKLIEQGAFLRALSFCMLLPGPEAMQLATFIGWKHAGVRGGLIAGGLFVLPGAVVIAILAIIYLRFGDVPFVAGAFTGIQAVVVLIVIQALWRLGQRVLTGAWAITFAIAAFLALYVFAAPFPVVILAALLGGALVFHKGATAPNVPPRLNVGKAPLAIAVLWLVPLAVLWLAAPGFYADIAAFFSKLAIVSFGGAYAALNYMTQTVVQDFGWITTDQMVDALGLAETTPGPLILVTQFVAMIAADGQGGWGTILTAGLIALWMTFLPCFLWVFALAPHIERLLVIPWLAAALSGVSAAVVGVIANLSLWFALSVYFHSGTLVALGPIQLMVPDASSIAGFPVVIAAFCALPLWRAMLPLPLVLAIAAAAGSFFVGVIT